MLNKTFKVKLWKQNRSKLKSYLKMHKIMTYLKIMMNNLKEEIQAATMKMNQMRSLLKSNILKIY